MLISYETAVYQLLQAPSSPNALLPTATIDSYINTARNQLAADTECIRAQALLQLNPGVATYAFASASFTGLNISGVAQPVSVRMIQINGNRLDLRPWEWFFNYFFNNAVSGTPTVAAQLGQGIGGTLTFNPTPSVALTADLDVVGLPVALINDTTPEAIPGLWADAVPFYAAWLALMSLQRQADANAMLARYKELARRGRQEATPSVLPSNLPGDIGTKAAAAKTTLTDPGQATGR